MSRWMIPLSCRYASPESTSHVMLRTCSSGTGPPASRTCESESGLNGKTRTCWASPSRNVSRRGMTASLERDCSVLISRTGLWGSGG